MWCKGARGQFAVANDTVIFVPGPVDDRSCPADRAAADDALLAALADAATWRRQGDVLVLAGSRQLRFRLQYELSYVPAMISSAQACPAWIAPL